MAYKNFTNGRMGQVRNNAGGFAYEIDQWTQLERFLILGSESGTYYVTPQALTLQNANALLKCLKDDPKRTVQIIRDISVSGRAAKADPAIFALAVAASPKYSRSPEYALAVLPEVLRIGTHLFQFMEYITEHRGLGRSIRRALGNWYLGKDVSQLQYQLVKYQQRNGWSHRDVLRLAHPKTRDVRYNGVFHWATTGELDEELAGSYELLDAVEWAHQTKDVGILCAIIHDHNLPWEAIPTQWLRNTDVRMELLRKMPIHAMVRQLGLYSSLGLTDMRSEGEDLIVAALRDTEKIYRSRLHPFEILKALQVYAQGRGERGSNTWQVNSRIVEALETAFYLGFANVEPTNKRILLGVDISGSMRNAVISGLSNMAASYGAAALALMLVNVEPYCDTVAFDTNAEQRILNTRMSIRDAMQQFKPKGNTDCGSVIDWAAKHEKIYDAILIFTDSETWKGNSNPWARFEAYRQTFNPDAKLITVAMTSNNFTLGPQDHNALDCVGFDTNVPQLIADFIR